VIDQRSTLEDVVFRICTALAKRDLQVLLVGGSAATYYAPKAYQSNDADFVAVFNVNRVREAEVVATMVELGYQLNGNTFEHTGGSPFTIEFPKGPPMVGGEAIRIFETVERGDEVLYVISPTDCVKDRLAQYYFWNDRTALRAAVAVTSEQQDRVDMSRIKDWSSREGEFEKFADFERLISGANLRPASSPVTPRASGDSTLN
jgi:hypothetical protein